MIAGLRARLSARALARDAELVGPFVSDLSESRAADP